MDTNATLSVIIKNPQGIVFEDQVKALTLFNDKGIFDILPLHENYISLIKKTITIYKLDNQTSTISIDAGLIKVFENNVEIFLGLQTLPLISN